MISFDSFVASQLGIVRMQKRLFMDAIGEIFISCEEDWVHRAMLWKSNLKNDKDNEWLGALADEFMIFNKVLWMRVDIRRFWPFFSQMKWKANQMCQSICYHIFICDKQSDRIIFRLTSARNECCALSADAIKSKIFNENGLLDEEKNVESEPLLLSRLQFFICIANFIICVEHK